MSRPSSAPDPDESRLVEEALTLWRDDARRAAEGIDRDEIADAALDAAAPGRASWRNERLAGRYAAAALVLLGLGVGGTVATVVASPAASAAAPQSLGSMESERFRLQSALEILELPMAEPVPARRPR